VSDLSTTAVGILVAAVSVASSALQQVLCRFYLKKHSVSANELLSTTAPLQVSSPTLILDCQNVILLCVVWSPCLRCCVGIGLVSLYGRALVAAKALCSL
jgi:hypothetical protein